MGPGRHPPHPPGAGWVDRSRASSFSFVWAPPRLGCGGVLIPWCKGWGRWTGWILVSSRLLSWGRGTSDPPESGRASEVPDMVSSATVGQRGTGTFTPLPKAVDAVPGGVLSTADSRRAPAAVDTGLGSVQRPGSGSSGQVLVHTCVPCSFPSIQGQGWQGDVLALSACPAG
ncbi:hypothetical protein GWK47_051731 [Chionoecetes opilio]|uniref:Uncharacterized protein n=1 Tax=Chionoecetes opilio TaxID=41210 RepID=A0A8J4Y754_CHIOP|nr:hypothetical protein GWK47_051731 [Chionoecetes opilio]